MTALVEELESRLRADVDSVRDGVSTRVDEITERLTHAGDALPGAEQVRVQVHEHPLTSMVGGFGAGVALGMLAGRDSDAEEEPQRRERRSPSRHRAGGMTSRLVDLFTAPMIMNTIAQPVQSEMRSLVQELVSGFLGTAERPERSQRRADPPHERREASGGVSGHEAGARTDGRTPAGDAHSKETASGLSGRERRP